LADLFFWTYYFDPLALCFLCRRVGIELQQDLVNELDVHIDLHDKLLQLFGLEGEKLV